MLYLVSLLLTWTVICSGFAQQGQGQQYLELVQQLSTDNDIVRLQLYQALAACLQPVLADPAAFPELLQTLRDFKWTENVAVVTAYLDCMLQIVSAKTYLFVDTLSTLVGLFAVAHTDGALP